MDEQCKTQCVKAENLRNVMAQLQLIEARLQDERRLNAFNRELRATMVKINQYESERDDA